DLIGQQVEVLLPARLRGNHARARERYGAAPHPRPMGSGLDLVARRQDGSEFPVEISLSPLHTDQGSLVMSIVRDITDRRRAEEQIQASLREKEALLREIHHRVKNNLQVTSSLLRLQAGAIGDSQAREVFIETQNRIRSMALVHEKLYQSTNLSGIDFAEYTRTLGDLLFKSFGVDPSRIALSVEGGGVLLSIDIAVPCGLIVNELLSNALKHAFPNQRKGIIRVTVAGDDDARRHFVVHDDGVGLPPELDVTATSTLGLQLVRGLIQQIDGKLDIERTDGTTFRIALPAERGR
ncbi:MAG TPA: histidine kinase dimerization/phosphoacceptor domain -containing protein, partial [Thermoanaerobaculia bacterium]|nr:histidine kinase dimerization/phosphoacceptor domain -containing protein [Thermoanaerobaculia bacterium]